LNSLVSEAVDIVVHSARQRGQVRITEILAVEELQTGPDATNFTTTELFRRARWDEPLVWTGNLPVRSLRAFEEAGCDLRELLEAGEASRAARAAGRGAA
jgi:pilus assembly protein CpaF